MNKFVPVIALFGIALIIAGVFALQHTKSNEDTTVEPTASNSVQDTNQLQTTDTVVGTGAEAVDGKTLVVNYTGTLTNGTQFDTSIGKQPFEFVLGAHQVIEGWDKGFAGMKVGGKRKLVIPPALGYGNQSAGSIPPNSTLLFDVELLDVK